MRSTQCCTVIIVYIILPAWKLIFEARVDFYALNHAIATASLNRSSTED